MEKITNEVTKVKNYILFMEYSKTKDVNIRNEIFEKYNYIAIIISKKFINKGIEYDDIYQIACIGLILAINRYDIEKGYEFSSFATPTILGEIKKYFRDKGWTIRVPRRIQELSNKINKTKVTLSQKLQKTPTIKDIAGHLNESEENILESMEANNMYIPKSLDGSLDNSKETSSVKISETIGFDDDNFTTFVNKDFIESVLKKLNQLEEKIIIERYFNNKTQIQIARELNISQMSVSRIERKVLNKFKVEFEK